MRKRERSEREAGKEIKESGSVRNISMEEEELLQSRVTGSVRERDTKK